MLHHLRHAVLAGDGALGKSVALIARAFGMVVVVFNRSPVTDDDAGLADQLIDNVETWQAGAPRNVVG